MGGVAHNNTTVGNKPKQARWSISKDIISY